MDVLGLFTDLALDPHESSCFDQRSQKLIGSIMIEFFVLQFKGPMKLLGLTFSVSTNV